MLNEDLLTHQEKEIAKLNLLIKNFKKYDKERKKYYKEAMIELGQLRSYIQEIDEGGDLLKRMKEYKKQISRYQELYEHQKIVIAALSKDKQSTQDLIQLEYYKKHYLEQKEQISTLTKRNTKLKEQIKTLHKQISELVYKLYGNNSKTSAGEQSNA